MMQKPKRNRFNCEKIHITKEKYRLFNAEKIQIISVLNGELSFSCFGDKHFLVDGDLILLYPHCEGELSALDDAFVLRLEFSPQSIVYSQQSAFEAKYFVPFLIKGTAPHILKNNKEANGILEKVFDEYSVQKLGYDSVIKAHTVSLLVLMLRQLKDSGRLPQRENKSEEASHIMQKAMAFTCEHFKTVTEKQAAEHCNLSYSYFSRSFKNAAGIGFSDYLNNLRINEAQRLLLFTNKTVTDIAMDLGYSTASHFISQFKKVNGISPKQYRTNLKGDNYEF